MPLITATPFFAPIIPIDWCSQTPSSTQTLVPSDTDSAGSNSIGFGSGVFGNAIKISQNGNFAVLGAYLYTAGGAVSADGACFVFEKIAGTWTEQQLLLPTSHYVNQRAGEAVGISGNGNVIAMGGSGGSSGANAHVYIFEKTGSPATWTLLQDIFFATGRALGRHVLLSDDGLHLLAARTFNDEMRYYNRATPGVPFTFRQSVVQADPQEPAKSISANASFDLFAMGIQQVGIESKVAVFTRVGNTWTENQLLDNVTSTGVLTRFGASTGMSEDGLDLIVAEPEKFLAASGYHVYTFRREGSPLQYVQKQDFLLSTNTSTSSISSCSISGDGTVGIIGHRSDTTQTGGSGAYYIMHKDPDTNIWSTPCGFGELGSSGMARSVDISADGKTLMVSDFGSGIDDDRVFVKQL